MKSFVFEDSLIRRYPRPGEYYIFLPHPKHIHRVYQEDIEPVWTGHPEQYAIMRLMDPAEYLLVTEREVREARKGRD